MTWTDLGQHRRCHYRAKNPGWSGPVPVLPSSASFKYPLNAFLGLLLLQWHYLRFFDISFFKSNFIEILYNQFLIKLFSSSIFCVLEFLLVSGFWHFVCQQFSSRVALRFSSETQGCQFSWILVSDFCRVLPQEMTLYPMGLAGTLPLPDE